MIVRTDAVVLRAMDYGETSRIVTLFTRQHGRMTVMAKGARRPKSRFGATLQPLAYVQAVYYYRDGRTMQTLKEASHVHRFPALLADVERTLLGLRAVELVRALFEDEEPNPLAFNLLLHTLERLDGAPAPFHVFAHFQLRLGALLGFAPDVQRQDVLALGEDGGTLALDTGAVLPLGAGARAGRRASRAALRAFAVFARADLETALRMRLEPEVAHEVRDLLDAFLRYHVEDAFPDRVRRVAAQIDTASRSATGLGRTERGPDF